MAQAREFSYEIVEKIAVIKTTEKGWTRELNRISYNGAAPKFDLRDWAPEHEKMGKGITLTEEDVQELKKALDEYFK